MRAPQRIHQFTNHSIKRRNIIVYKQPWRTTSSWFTQQLSESVIVRNLQWQIYMYRL